MPHAIVEWTDNLLADGFEIKPLLDLIAQAMRDADGMFPLGGIRVRGIRLEDYVIADGSGQDAFINITMKIGPGRPAEAKQRVFTGIFGAVDAHLQPLFDKRFLALALYVEEADEAGSFKHNNIHTRFRKTT